MFAEDGGGGVDVGDVAQDTWPEEELVEDGLVAGQGLLVVGAGGVVGPC